MELQFSAGLLSYPDRVENAEKTADGEKVPLPSDDSSSLSKSHNLYVWKILYFLNSDRIFIVFSCHCFIGRKKDSDPDIYLVYNFKMGYIALNLQRYKNTPLLNCIQPSSLAITFWVGLVLPFSLLHSIMVLFR